MSGVFFLFFLLSLLWIVRFWLRSWRGHLRSLYFLDEVFVFLFLCVNTYLTYLFCSRELRGVRFMRYFSNVFSGQLNQELAFLWVATRHPMREQWMEPTSQIKIGRKSIKNTKNRWPEALQRVSLVKLIKQTGQQIPPKSPHKTVNPIRDFEHIKKPINSLDAKVLLNSDWCPVAFFSK